MHFSKTIYGRNLAGLNRPQKRRLDKFCRRLGRDEKRDLFDDQFLKLILAYAWNPKYVQSIRQYLNRIGFTQSHKQYSMIEEQVKERFCAKNHPDFSWHKCFQEVKDEITELFREFHLEEVQYFCDEDIEHILSKLTTHAGWYGYILHGKLRKGENLEGLYDEFMRILNEAKESGTLHQPMLPGVRTQSLDVYGSRGDGLKAEGEYAKAKTRTILMVSLIQIVLELKWSKPLQNAMHNVDWYMGGLNDKQIHRRVRNNFVKYKHWISLDYSKYDTTISDWLLRASYDVYKACFESDPNFDAQAWEIMVHDAICKRIVLADGKYYLSTKGNASGLQFTSMNASMCNYLAISTCMKLLMIKDYALMIMGDDILIFTNVKIDYHELCSLLERNFGLIAHPDKCVTEEECANPVFLSREWREMGAYRSPLEILAKGLFPESFRNYQLGEPALVVYSYILSFPLGMRELIDVDRFMSDFPHIREEFSKYRGGSLLTGSQRWRQGYELDPTRFDLPSLIAA